MWSRANFKQQAKNILSRTYWLSFAACLVSGLIIGAISFIANRLNLVFQVIFGLGNTYSFGFLTNGANDFSDYSNPFVYGVNPFVVLGFFTLAYLFYLVFMFAADFFLTYPISVGLLKFFLESRKGHSNFENVFSSFKNGRYVGVVKGMAWKFLFTFLWSLLFIIPGIIKSFSYSMVPYLLADNPKMNYDRALKLSMRMTDGYKWDIFVLQLSFIGWYLLGALCCGIGTFFVTPYNTATNVEMYAFLRKNAIGKGFVNPAELNLTQEDSMLDYPTQPNY